MVDSIINIGLRGYNDAISRAGKAAQDIASQSVSDASKESLDKNDLAQSLVDLKVAEHDAKANIKVLETAEDLIGTLLDIKA